MTANEEFAAEVTRLYQHEEKLSEEHRAVKDNLESVVGDLEQKLLDDGRRWEEERGRLEAQEQRLMDSVKMLSQDNARLITEREQETLSQSKTHQVSRVRISQHITGHHHGFYITATIPIIFHFQELQTQFEEERVKLEVTISCLKTELENEKCLKHESDLNVLEMHKMIERSDAEIEKMKDDHNYASKQLKETFESRIRLLEQKSEKLAAENFEYSIENEELNKKLQSSVMNYKSLEKELGQLKVENHWLVGSQKKCSSIEEKIEESAREIQELRKELREEKTKVRMCSHYDHD